MYLTTFLASILLLSLGRNTIVAGNTPFFGVTCVPHHSTTVSVRTCCYMVQTRLQERHGNKNDQGKADVAGEAMPKKAARAACKGKVRLVVAKINKFLVCRRIHAE